MSMQYTPSYGVNHTMNPFYNLGSSNWNTQSNQFNNSFGGQPQPSMNQNAMFNGGNIYGGAPTNYGVQYQTPQLPPPPQSQFIPPQNRSTDLYQNVITNNYYIEVPVPVYIQAPPSPPSYHPPGCYDCGPGPMPYPPAPQQGGFFGSEMIMNTLMMLMSLFSMLGDNPVIDNPVDDPVDDPVIDDPVVDDPIDDNPVDDPVDDPVIDDPVVDDPIDDNPVDEPIDDPVLDDPIVDDPIDEPVVDDPVEVDPGLIDAAPVEFTTLNSDDMKYIIEHAAGDDGKLTATELDNYITAVESGFIQNELEEKIADLDQEISDLQFDYDDYYTTYQEDELQEEIYELQEQLDRLNSIQSQGESLRSVFNEVAAFDSDNNTISVEDIDKAAKEIEDDNQITDVELGFESLDSNINKNVLFEQINSGVDYSLSDLESKLGQLSAQITAFENDPTFASEVSDLKKQKSALEFIMKYFEYAEEGGVINQDLLNSLAGTDGNNSNISLQDLVG